MMRFLLLLISTLLFFASCNNFYHLHYRKLNKISAHPLLVETRESAILPVKTERTLRPGKRQSPILEIQANEKTEVKDNENSSKQVSEKLFSIKKKINPEIKKQKLSSPKRKPAPELFVFALFLVMLLGLGMIIGGIWLLFLGITGGIIWMMICGPLIFLLGLPVLFGMIALCFGTRPDHPDAYK